MNHPLAFQAPRPSPALSGLLVAGFCTSLLVGHYGYYGVALALGAGRAARVDVDLADPGSYRFLWSVFTAGLSRWLLFAEVVGFLVGFAWGIVVRGCLRRRNQAPISEEAG